LSRLVLFVSDRVGWEKYLKPLVEKPLPSDLGWTVTLGSVSVLLFVLEVVTGMFLAMYYNPSPDHAYQSIDYIMKDVHMGWILRGIHHWGAGAMVVVVFVHMVSTFFQGAFKPPRELTWIIGVFLFLMTLGFGFTGYLLPWDQKAFWATVVGTNIPKDIPVIGEFLTRVLLAGDRVSGLTLSRFYSIHTLILPSLMFLLIVFHIYLVRIHDIAPPAASNRSENPNPSDKKTPHRFFPEHLFKCAIAFVFVFTLILLLSIFAEIPREDIAGTIDPTYLPRPEWYYMWLFQLLTFFTGSAEIIGSLAIPVGTVLFLFFLPFLSKSPLRSPADRPIATSIGVACLVGIIYLTMMGIGNSRPYGDIIVIPDRKLTRVEKKGLNVFVERECAYCHHILGKGGRREGPDLSNVIEKDRTKDWLLKFIKDPQATSSWSIMPKYDLSEEELNALVEFILSLDFRHHGSKMISRRKVIEGNDF